MSVIQRIIRKQHIYEVPVRGHHHCVEIVNSHATREKGAELYRSGKKFAIYFLIFSSDFDIPEVITIAKHVQFIKATVQYWSGAGKCDFGPLLSFVYMPLRAGVESMRAG